MKPVNNPSERIVPVILSGGAGTRLWPLSTSERPKQFLALTDPSASMFQLTLARCKDPELFAAPIVVANARHADLVKRQLAESGIAPRAILLEPAARNTAPAIALAALEADNNDALLLVMPSDHVIADTAAFLDAVSLAAPAAEYGALVTFGIEPTHAETGYGYFAMGEADRDQAGVFTVDRFVEKPDVTTAQSMLDSGHYLWNAGIFLFSAGRYLDELARHEPEILRSVRAALDSAKRAGAIVTPDPAAFAACPAQSIDYGVMERADDVVTVPLLCGWSDVRSWDAIADLAAHSDQAHGSDAATIDSSGNYVHADGVRVSLCGVTDMIVVATREEVMIVPRGQSQRVREIVDARAKKAD